MNGAVCDIADDRDRARKRCRERMKVVVKDTIKVRVDIDASVKREYHIFIDLFARTKRWRRLRRQLLSVFDSSGRYGKEFSVLSGRSRLHVRRGSLL